MPCLDLVYVVFFTVFLCSFICWFGALACCWIFYLIRTTAHRTAAAHQSHTTARHTTLLTKNAANVAIMSKIIALCRAVSSGGGSVVDWPWLHSNSITISNRQSNKPSASSSWANFTQQKIHDHTWSCTNLIKQRKRGTDTKIVHKYNESSISNGIKFQLWCCCCCRCWPLWVHKRYFVTLQGRRSRGSAVEVMRESHGWFIVVCTTCSRLFGSSVWRFNPTHY